MLQRSRQADSTDLGEAGLQELQLGGTDAFKCRDSGIARGKVQKVKRLIQDSVQRVELKDRAAAGG